MWKSVILWQRCLWRTGCHPARATPRQQQPAPPPRAPGWERRMWDWQRGQGKECLESGQERREWAAMDPVPLWLPAHNCKVTGGIVECHPAITTTDWRHFIYQLAFFANSKYLCILIGRIKMSLLQWGTLVIRSKWFVLSPCTSCIWEAVKNFKHLAMF